MWINDLALESCSIVKWSHSTRKQINVKVIIMDYKNIPNFPGKPHIFIQTIRRYRIQSQIHTRGSSYSLGSYIRQRYLATKQDTRNWCPFYSKHIYLILIMLLSIVLILILSMPLTYGFNHLITKATLIWSILFSLTKVDN